MRNLRPIARKNWIFRDRLTGWAFRSFSMYVVPVIIVLASAMILLWAPQQFDTSGAVPIDFSVIADPTATLTPESAVARLASDSPPIHTSNFSTHLVETPFWFQFVAPAIGDVDGTFIDLPSRHAMSLDCWRTKPTITALGQADRYATNGGLHQNKAGFALQFEEKIQSPILCKGTFSGPAHITASAMSGKKLYFSSLDYYQNAALITGGLVTLAIFVFVTAIINREWTYVIFAAWLIGNLRLSANAIGFDNEWLGRVIPPEHLPLIRAVTFASYYLLTGALFEKLFRRELKSIGLRWGWQAVRYVGFILLLAAVTVSYRHFLPVLWLTTTFGVAVVTYFLVQLVFRARSRTVLWFVAAIAVVLYATLSEVVAAVFPLHSLGGLHSPVVTALSSSMLCAFAIAERVREERERRREMQKELRNTYDVAPIGLFTLNLENNLVRANPAAHAMLGLTHEQEGPRQWRDYFAPGTEALVRDHLNLNGSQAIEIDGAEGTITAGKRFSLRAIRSNALIEGSLEDVTESSLAVQRLHFLADHDTLTGLLNRRGIEQAIARSKNDKWALVYLDLDRFKVFNDLFGHNVGDEILKYIAAHLTKHLGQQTPIARIGGDEFVCVLENTSIDKAIHTCTVITLGLNTTPIKVGTRAFQARASIGIVECDAKETFEDILGLADRACRAAKRAGSDQVVAYRKGAPAFAQRADEIHLITALQQNRLPDGLFLVMQPVMSVSAPDKSLDFEVLLRMRTPDGAVATAGNLIAAAEDSGTIKAVDRWVMTTTLEWLRKNQASLTTTRFVSVNLSAGSLNDENFLSELFALFSKYADVIRFVCVEITESVALHDLKHTQRFIDRVHNMGARIAIDDFGAGHTSLRYLKNLSADALKIDGEFVRTMCQHPTDMAIVEALITLARNLGMRSVAEWVEDLDTYKALEELGVDYVQGFGVVRPLEPAALLTASSAAKLIVDPGLKAYLAGKHSLDFPIDPFVNPTYH